MNPVKTTPPLSARTVSDTTEQNRLRWFHLRRCVESGILNELPTSLPPEPFGSHCRYFGVYQADEIVGTMRLVEAPEPEIFCHHKFFPHVADRLEKSQVIEITKLAISPDSPRFQALRLLLKELVQFTVNAPDGVVLLASVHPHMVSCLDRLFAVPVEVVGPQIDEYGDFEDPTVPIMFDTRYGLRVLRQQQREHSTFVSDDLVIDLTEEPFSHSVVSQRKDLLRRHAAIGAR